MGGISSKPKEKYVFRFFYDAPPSTRAHVEWVQLFTLEVQQAPLLEEAESVIQNLSRSHALNTKLKELYDQKNFIALRVEGDTDFTVHRALEALNHLIENPETIVNTHKIGTVTLSFQYPENTSAASLLDMPES